MLPTTTRKRLSHLRAQIRRQASKAARSRLEKRSSVGGPVGNTDDSVSGDRAGQLGMSFDATTSKRQQQLILQHQHQTTEGASSHEHYQHQKHSQHQNPHHNHHHRELHNQPNSSSSTDSPNTHLSNQSTSSPATAGTNINNNNNPEINISSNLSPISLHNDSGPSSSTNHAVGPSGTKLIGQHSVPGSGTGRGSHSNNHPSIHQKNFKQKIIALLKKFRTDGSDFDSEEQYREALERELMKAAAGRGSRSIEELLETELDVKDEASSDIEDWDDISESSTPKPSLKPFFSSTTLDKI